MQPAIEAALATIRHALKDLDAALADLPDEAANWAPAPNANSAAILVRHSITATRYLIGVAAGTSPDRDAYVKGDRVDAFAAQAGGVAELRDALKAGEAEIAAIMARGTDASLAAKQSWTLADEQPLTGMRLLVHAPAHLREHVGHVQLIRDLWVAGRRG